MEWKKITSEETKVIMTEILEQFDKYCKTHQLTYFLAGGTLLGAIRHHGFIPWDDDVDVLMPIADYEKLLELAVVEPIGKNLFLSDYKHNPKHIWLATKLIRRDTFFIESNIRKKYEKNQKELGGICIDIFPIYGLPNNKIRRKYFLYQIQNKHDLNSMIIYKIAASKNHPLLKHIVIFIIKLILWPFCWIYEGMHGYGKPLDDLNKLIIKFDYNQAEYVGTSLGIYRKDMIPKHCFDQTIEAQFEYLNCPIPVGYDEYLRTLYGDYMVIPPENERRIHLRSDIYWKY